MINKDVVHAKMRRRIEKPRILLLDCTLEYKKGESQTQIELSDEKAWEGLLEEEENAIKEMCSDIISHKPDLVVTEKGVSDLAQHYLQKAGISVLRRLRKTDNNRIARASGANATFGIDGEKGTLADMNELGVWEPVAVKQQTIKTAVESASMLLRIDEIVAGTNKPKK